MKPAVVRYSSAESIIAALRRHEPELRAAGIEQLSLFGSVARGDANTESDIDLAAGLDPAAELSLLDLTALERRLSEILGRPVDLLPEPTEKHRLQVRIDRERRRAF